MTDGTLFARITAWPNLLRAARLASRGKRHTSNVGLFNFRLETELLALQSELRARTYRPGAYRTFIVHEKKPRLISAAPFRDRVVHHALCNVIEPIFDRGFLFDSYACRKGKGTHAAVERASAYARRFRYVLKCDVEKYFPSIDHEILCGLIVRRIHDEGVLWLARRVIDGSNPQPEIIHHFPGDDLFAPHERRRGIPIGNQTSQFFANVYLDGLDHYVKDTLGAPGYVRYVDDLLVFDRDKRRLAEIRDAVMAYCEGLRLRLQPRKTILAPVSAGFTFLGYRLFPSHRRVEADNVRRFKRRLRRYRVAVGAGELSLAEARHAVESWRAHAAHAETARLQRDLLQGVAWLDGPGTTGSVAFCAPWRVVEQ